MSTYTGGCLCGRVRYEASGSPSNPHFCSCRQCQKWSGAPTVAWVDFPRAGIRYTGPGGEPTLFRSSAAAQRGHCPACGGAICALDEGSETVSMTIASLDDPDTLVPRSHSYPESAPTWLRVDAAD